MANSKKPRKAYKPKRVVTNPAALFFGGMSDQHSAHLQETLLALHVCMSKLARGVADANDWNNINQAINMSIIFAECGVGNEWLPQILAARDAIAACVLRFQKSGRIGVTGDELKAINEGIDVHDNQITVVRGKDVDYAAKELNRRLKHGVNVSSAFDPNVLNVIRGNHERVA